MKDLRWSNIFSPTKNHLNISTTTANLNFPTKKTQHTPTKRKWHFPKLEMDIVTKYLNTNNIRLLEASLTVGLMENPGPRLNRFPLLQSERWDGFHGSEVIIAAGSAFIFISLFYFWWKAWARERASGNKDTHRLLCKSTAESRVHIESPETNTNAHTQDRLRHTHIHTHARTHTHTDTHTHAFACTHWTDTHARPQSPMYTHTHLINP